MRPLLAGHLIRHRSRKLEKLTTRSRPGTIQLTKHTSSTLLIKSLQAWASTLSSLPQCLSLESSKRLIITIVPRLLSTTTRIWAISEVLRCRQPIHAIVFCATVSLFTIMLIILMFQVIESEQIMDSPRLTWHSSMAWLSMSESCLQANSVLRCFLTTRMTKCKVQRLLICLCLKTMAIRDHSRRSSTAIVTRVLRLITIPYVSNKRVIMYLDRR